jgi:capsule polysaccharide modification protein KpsS
MGASISIYLDTRIKKADNVYPVKIRATYNRERLYLGIDKARINNKLEGSQLEKFRYDGKGNYSIDEDSFNKAIEAKKAGIFKELQAVFKGIELDAQRKADSLDPFTLDRFKSMMSKTRSKKNQVFAQFDELIDELKESERIGTAVLEKTVKLTT